VSVFVICIYYVGIIRGLTYIHYGFVYLFTPALVADVVEAFSGIVCLLVCAVKGKGLELSVSRSVEI